MTSIAKYNRLIIGLIPGIIIPFITLIIFYLFKSGVANFFDYVHFMIKNGCVFKYIKFMPLPNLAIFYYFLNKSYYYSARGVIFSNFYLGISSISISIFSLTNYQLKYYIIAGEASGDLHASNLIEKIKKFDSQATFRGWGGDLMIKNGMFVVKHIRDLAFMVWLK